MSGWPRSAAGAELGTVTGFAEAVEADRGLDMVMIAETGLWVR